MEWSSVHVGFHRVPVCAEQPELGLWSTPHRPRALAYRPVGRVRSIDHRTMTRTRMDHASSSLLDRPSPVDEDTAPHRRKRHAYERAPDERINKLASIPFWLIHALALLGLVLFGLSTKTVVLCVVLFFGRMWFITAGYHRYFAHRSYKTSRWFQFVLAFGGATAAQKGPLWWAGHHRNHHR